LLAVHVALMLAALAGFTLAAALAALYLWHARRLKRHERTILRVRVPPLDSLESLAAAAAAVSLAALTAGIGFGVADLVREGGRFDAAMAATLVAWAAYATLLALAWSGGLRGRRAARATLAAFTLVVVTLTLAHFG
jgi:ABC-type uncharacterized transport system permease subunit